jgi:hypothetical protein
MQMLLALYVQKKEGRSHTIGYLPTSLGSLETPCAQISTKPEPRYHKLARPILN